MNKNFAIGPTTAVKKWWTFHCHSILKALPFIALIAKLNSWSIKKKNAQVNLMKKKVKKWAKKDKIFSNLSTVSFDLIFFKAKSKHKITFNPSIRKKIKNVRKKKIMKIILEWCDFQDHWFSKKLIFHLNQPYSLQYDWFNDSLLTKTFTIIFSKDLISEN